MLYLFRGFDPNLIIISPKAIIEKGVRFIVRSETKVEIERAVISRYSKIVLVGGSICIRKGCTIGEYAIFNAFSDIELDEDVMTADKVSLITNTHNYFDVNVPIWKSGGGAKRLFI